MLSCIRAWSVVGVLSALSAVALSGLARAQDEKTTAESRGEKVHFTTVDGVEINGIFYPGQTKQSAPSVLLLHALGEDSRKKGWPSLAEALNKAGCAVLTFDFRGHGQSKDVQPKLFWKYPRNAASVKGAPKENIDFRDMGKDYYPVLVNDIAAAKAYLDNQNDARRCNTANLVVLGAETGATLGAIWLNAEWHRVPFIPATYNGVLLATPAKLGETPEGKGVIGAVWLSASSKLGSRTISLSTILDSPGRVHGTPMVFLYGEDDGTAKTIAKACETRIKAKKNDDKSRLTAAIAVKGASKLSGAGLLQSSLTTEADIVDYVKNVAEVARGNEWSEREFRKTQYVWRIPANRFPLPTAQTVAQAGLPVAKLPEEKTLSYSTYEMFLQGN